MSINSDKYRGTTAYHVAFGELVTAARYRGTVTYQELADLIGLPTVGVNMGREIGQLLGEIAEDEHARGRPMLAALAVSVSGRPGPGFYGCARELGKLAREASPRDERKFWESERDAVYAIWKWRISERTKAD